MKRKCTPLARVLDKGVSFYAYGAAIVLVIYMIATFHYWYLEFLCEFPWNFSYGRSRKTGGRDGLLAFIAFAIVLIKAYRILISYAKTQHVNIKYLVEIAIIAPAIEILFNSHGYHFEILVLFGVFGIANLVIYVWKYDKFKEIGKDSDHD